jgi:hypothetical protein
VKAHFIVKIAITHAKRVVGQAKLMYAERLEDWDHIMLRHDVNADSSPDKRRAQVLRRVIREVQGEKSVRFSGLLVGRIRRQPRNFTQKRRGRLPIGNLVGV